MQHHASATLDAIRNLVRLCGYDPWSLTLAERHALAQAMQGEQSDWLPRLERLTEPPSLQPDFPAFLLATPAFDELRNAVGDARQIDQLDTGAADLLQHFVDRYREYLRAA